MLNHAYRQAMETKAKVELLASILKKLEAAKVTEEQKEQIQKIVDKHKGAISKAGKAAEFTAEQKARIDAARKAAVAEGKMEKRLAKLRCRQ